MFVGLGFSGGLGAAGPEDVLRVGVWQGWLASGGLADTLSSSEGPTEA